MIILDPALAYMILSYDRSFTCEKKCIDGLPKNIKGISSVVANCYNRRTRLLPDRAPKFICNSVISLGC